MSCSTHGNAPSPYIPTPPQGSLVERIDDHASDSLANMEAGQAQLARAWERVSSNRALVLKGAAVVIGTAVMFALFG